MSSTLLYAPCDSVGGWALALLAAAADDDDGFDIDDEVDELLAPVPVAAKAKFNPAQHLRVLSGEHGGEFRDMYTRVMEALRKWAAAGGRGDPLPGFEREPLRRFAVSRGVRLPRGATRDVISGALLADLRGELEGGPRKAPAKKAPAKKAPTAPITTKKPKKAPAKAVPSAPATRKGDTPPDPEGFDRRATTAAAGADALTSAPTLVTFDADADTWTAAGVPERDRVRVGKAVATWWDRGQDINEYLRDGSEAYRPGRGKLTAAANRRTIADLDRLYEVSRLQRDTVVWRGFGGRSLFGADPDAWPDDLAGTEWVDLGYVSSAAERSEASNFTVGGSAGPMDQRGVLARMLLPGGAPVLSLSEMEATELLLSRGWTFRVVRDHGWVEEPRRAGVRRHRLLDVEATPPATPTAKKAVPAPAKATPPAARVREHLLTLLTNDERREYLAGLGLSNAQANRLAKDLGARQTRIDVDATIASIVGHFDTTPREHGSAATSAPRGRSALNMRDLYGAQLGDLRPGDSVQRVAPGGKSPQPTTTIREVGPSGVVVLADGSRVTPWGDDGLRVINAPESAPSAKAVPATTPKPTSAKVDPDQIAADLLAIPMTTPDERVQAPDKARTMLSGLTKDQLKKVGGPGFPFTAGATKQQMVEDIVKVRVEGRATGITVEGLWDRLDQLAAAKLAAPTAAPQSREPNPAGTSLHMLRSRDLPAGMPNPGPSPLGVGVGGVFDKYESRWGNLRSSPDDSPAKIEADLRREATAMGGPGGEYLAKIADIIAAWRRGGSGKADAAAPAAPRTTTPALSTDPRVREDRDVLSRVGTGKLTAANVDHATLRRLEADHLVDLRLHEPYGAPGRRATDADLATNPARVDVRLTPRGQTRLEHPTATPDEAREITAARTRQRQERFDRLRVVAETLTLVDELRENGASDRAVEHRLRSAGKRNQLPADMVDELIAAGTAGDRTRIDEIIDRIATEHGLTRISAPAGGVEPFDRRKHQPLVEGSRLRDGQPVHILRAGYMALDEGDEVQLHRAVVDEATPEETARVGRPRVVLRSPAKKAPAKTAAPLKPAKKTTPRKTATKKVAPTVQPDSSPAVGKVDGRDLLADGDVEQVAVRVVAEARDFRYSSQTDRPGVAVGDPGLSAIARMQGFDGLPQVVDAAELDRLYATGGVQLSRGVSPDMARTRAQAKLDPTQIHDQMRYGQAHYGGGFAGSGYYFGAGPEGAASLYGDQTTGSVVRATLAPDTRITDLATLAREYEAFAAAHGMDRPRGATGWDFAETVDPAWGGAHAALPETDLERVFWDRGRFAAARGYDAYWVTPGHEMVVLNRTKLIVEAGPPGPTKRAPAKKSAVKKAAAPRKTAPAGTTGGKDLLRTAPSRKALADAAVQARDANPDRPHGDEMLYAIATRQGFTAHPRRVDRTTFDTMVADGQPELWRGMETQAHADQLVSGDYRAADNLGYGSGISLSKHRMIARRYGDDLVRVTFAPDTRVVDLDEVLAGRDRRLAGLAPDDPQRLVFSDPGRYAAARGIDVIRIPGDPLDEPLDLDDDTLAAIAGEYGITAAELTPADIEALRNPRNDHYIVLNRGVLVVDVESSSLSPAAARVDTPTTGVRQTAAPAKKTTPARKTAVKKATPTKAPVAKTTRKAATPKAPTTPVRLAPIATPTPTRLRSHLTAANKVDPSISHDTAARTTAALTRQGELAPRAAMRLRRVDVGPTPQRDERIWQPDDMPGTATGYIPTGDRFPSDGQRGPMIRFSYAWREDPEVIFGAAAMAQEREFFVPGLSEHMIEAYVAHEFGHHLIAAITSVWDEDGDRGWTDEQVRRLFYPLAEELGIDPPELDPKPGRRGVIFSLATRLRTWRTAHTEQITTGVSRYGSYSNQEMLAEIWSEYSVLGEDARPLARRVGPILRDMAEEALTPEGERGVPVARAAKKAVPTIASVLRRNRKAPKLKDLFGEGVDDREVRAAVAAAIGGEYPGGLHIEDAYQGTIQSGRGAAPDGVPFGSIYLSAEVKRADGTKVGYFNVYLQHEPAWDQDAGDFNGPPEWTVYINDFYLDAGVQGHGFGSAFTGNLLDWARRSGFDYARLGPADIGMYAWPSMGFDFHFDDPRDLEDMLAEGLSPTAGIGALRAWHGMSDEQAREAWKVVDEQMPLLEAAIPLIRAGQISAYEVSQLGRKPGQGKDDFWIGKLATLGGMWGLRLPFRNKPVPKLSGRRQPS